MKGTLYHARGVALTSATDDVQILPPGTHAISPTRADGGEPVDLTVTINAATANTLEAARAQYQAQSDAQTGDAPYLDFNHDDGPAAAWVKSIYWAGDDPKTGGVRAKVEWTDAGREAVEGRLFRRFSPAFTLDDKTGAISGAPVNMGGLVNRAAFRTIAALFNKQTNPAPMPTMTEEQIAALQKENETLAAQIADLQKQLAAASEKDAKTQVDAAASEGRIAPDETVKAKWVKSLLASPGSSDLLASLPVNPSFKAIPKDEPKDRVITRDELREQFAALPRAERDTFFAKHREALLARN